MTAPATHSVGFTVVVVLMCCAIGAVIGLAIYYGDGGAGGVAVRGGRATLVVERRARLLRLRRGDARNRTEVFVADLARGVPAQVLPGSCPEPHNASDLCLSWAGHVTLSVDVDDDDDDDDDDASCFVVRWKAELGGRPVNCFHLAGAFWYGGWAVGADWPLGTTRLERKPYVLGDAGFGPVLERYWLTSNGVAIVAAAHFELDVSLNAATGDGQSDGRLCLYAGGQRLEYTLCVATDVRSVHRSIMRRHFDKTDGSRPDERFVESPVWSAPPNTSLVGVTTAVRRHGYGLGHLVADVDWDETESVAFRPLNVSVLLVVRPYTAIDAGRFVEFATHGALLTADGGLVVGACRHDGGFAGVWAMHDAAVAQLRRRLTSTRRRLNVTSFVFLPPCAPVHSSSYTDRYVRLAAGFGTATVVATGYRTQTSLPLWLLADAAESSWEGLRSLVPTLLQLSVLGYAYVLPGAVGGRRAGAGGLPDRELYLRWLQLAAFLPALHLSVPPHAYDNDTLRIATEILALRTSVVVPRVLALIAPGGATAIVTPLWSHFSNDDVALETDSQFLVGGDLLVAPVLSNGSRTRDIYLPTGTWQCGLTSKYLTGPVWLNGYPVEIQQIAYFILV